MAKPLRNPSLVDFNLYKSSNLGTGDFLKGIPNDITAYVFHTSSSAFKFFCLAFGLTLANHNPGILSSSSTESTEHIVSILYSSTTVDGPVLAIATVVPYGILSYIYTQGRVH